MWLEFETHSSSLIPTPKLPVKEKDWRLNKITNGQWFNQACLCNDTLAKNKISTGTPEWQGSGVSGVGNTSRCWDLEGAWKFLEDPPLCALSHASLPSTWLSLSCLLNNVLNASEVSSWALWVTIASYWAWGGGRGNPKFVVSQAEVVGSPGTSFVAGVWSQSSLVGLSP